MANVVRIALALVGGGAALASAWLALGGDGAVVPRAGAYALGLALAVGGAAFVRWTLGRLVLVAGLALAILVGVVMFERPTARAADVAETAVALAAWALAATTLWRPAPHLDALAAIGIGAWAVVLGVGGLLFELSRAEFQPAMVAFALPLALACVSLLVWTGRETVA